ncbi:MAG: mRNA surveillance protein pelota, partial [Candidatus Methanospirareceae archaeon]
EEEVKEALQYGAVETLLISDEKLSKSREGEGEEDMEQILKEVERTGGSFMVLSTEFEPGKRLNGLGGIAAILRFKISANKSDTF